MLTNSPSHTHSHTHTHTHTHTHSHTVPQSHNETMLFVRFTDLSSPLFHCPRSGVLLGKEFWDNNDDDDDDDDDAGWFLCWLYAHSSLCSLFFSWRCRFINARRRIVQPMIDQSNRAGKSPVVTVFKSRRRKSSSGQSPGPSPGPHSAYSPDPAGLMQGYGQPPPLGMTGECLEW